MISRGRQRLSVLMLVAGCCSIGVWGEERAAKEFKDHPIFSDKAPAPSGTVAAEPAPKPESSSAGVSSRVRGLIKITLPAPAPKAPTSEVATPVDVVKLAPVLVEAPKLKLLDTDQIMSREEFAATLRKRYPGASLPGQDPYNIANGLPNYARLQYETDRRNALKTVMEDFADLLEHTGDHASSQRLKKEIQNASKEAYKDPLVDAMDKSANRGRR